MAHEDVVIHGGETYRLAHLVANVPDEIREAVHQQHDGKDAQGFWDALTLLDPEAAALAVEATPPADTIWDVLSGDEYLDMDAAGGVVRIRDEQVTWWAEEKAFDAAVERAKRACVSREKAYDVFCGWCPGVTDDNEESLPLKARYAGGAFDMASEGGREQAASDVFGDDADALAFACMLLDRETER